MSASTGVGVVTIVSGRRAHLAGLLEGLRRQTRPADQLVVVRMDREEVTVPSDVAARVTVVDLDAAGGRLPLAAARNAGVAELRTDAVILLDVDCIPGAALVESYRRAVLSVDGLVCGSLRYLSPGRPGHARCWDETDLRRDSHPHAARPRPGTGHLVREDRPELAWTTTLAFRRASFQGVGGFDEAFRGYGGEDTDFAVRAVGTGLGVWWTDDPVAYHQHHPTQDPPVQHLDDIVRNASLFAERHGWYPMAGWLAGFRDLGLVDFDPGRGRLARRSPGRVG